MSVHDMTESMKAEFIAAFRAKFHFGEMTATANDQADAMLQAAAWGWQASRAALVIELPPTPQVPEYLEEAIDDSHMDAYHSAVGMRHACLKFIEAAGVKVAK